MKKLTLILLTALSVIAAGCINPMKADRLDPTETPSGEKAITAFSFASPAATGVITEETHTVAVTVPFATDTSSLVPTITVSVGATVSPLSVTAQNFSSPVTYTVTAADGTKQVYVVTVIIAPDAPVPSAVNLTLKYVFGTSPSGYNNVYVIWIENADRSLLRPLSICERLVISGGLAESDALPFWHLGRLPVMKTRDSGGVDAVSGATLRKQNFNTAFTIAAGAPRQFNVYFETDVSFTPNDWFPSSGAADQPSIVYSAYIDLDSTAASWDLTLAGWSANGSQLAQAKAVTGNAALTAGSLVEENGYIEKLKTAAGGFGSADPRSQTSLVGSLRVVRD